jgi:hypothetical protein
LAESGETLVSRDAWQYVAKHAKGRPTANGPFQLLDVTTPGEADKTAQAASFDSSRLASYVPQILRSRLASSLSRWLAELRTVTTCFIRFTAPDLFDDLTRLEKAYNILESRIARFHGDLLRITASEGGLLTLAVFGLPGNAHKDDPRRAILAGLELQADVSRIGMNVSIGIATGDVFCGAIGTDRRAEYTVLGEAVNCAARLAAIAAGRALVDELTAQKCSNFVSFQGPWSMQVPGVRAPIQTFVALRPKREDAAALQDNLVGRTDELNRLNALIDGGLKARLAVIVGEPGVGKSALANAFTQHCIRNGVMVFDSFADDVEQNTPYFAFRRILRRLLGLELLQGREAYERIEARLASRPEEISFIPLLADVLDIGLEGTSITDDLASSVRYENLRRLLKNFVIDGMSANRSVLIVEDVHWLDAASAALLADVLQEEPPITVVLTSRSEKLPQEILQRVIDVSYLTLEPLDEDQTAELVNSSLEHASIPVWLHQAIWQRTGGNPFFVGEICQMIKQRRPETWPRIVPRLETFDEDNSIVLPQSARIAVLNRTDALLGDEQFVLKIASAMGPTFTVSDLEAIELIKNAGINASECVVSLTTANLIKALPVYPARFTFSHKIIRDAVYAGMLSAQKQEAHVAIAKAIERGGRVSEAEMLPLVLNQWQRAGDPSKTFEYLDRVAELRLRQFENAAAIAHSEEFLDIARKEAITAPAARLAAAHFVLGEAELNLGRMHTARTSFEKGLRLLNMPMPRTKIGLALSMLSQIGEHLFRSKRPSGQRQESFSAAANEIVTKAARAYDSLTYIHYFNGDKARLVYSTLRATNLAEFAGLSSLLAVNYSSLGAICGVIPLRRRAEQYLKRAFELSAKLGIPSVSAKVNLLGGLYKTSVGDWLSAKSLFEPGLKQAHSLGDIRRWSELAVSLETIISPWLLNPSYSGKQAWSELVDKICETARSNGDPQVLGGGLTGAIRGYRILGADDRAHAYLDELTSFVREQSAALEPIHRLEGAAFLAEAALDCGNVPEWEHWLARAAFFIDEVNPTIKSRTLTALSAAFRIAVRAPQHAERVETRQMRRRLAKKSAANLGRFARIYPIGRPRAFLFQGDLELNLGNTARASRLWRRALVDAAQLKMPADALASLARLRKTGSNLAEIESMAVRNLDALLLDHNSEFRKTAELTASALAIGGRGAIA